jgi:protein MpaA
LRQVKTAWQNFRSIFRVSSSGFQRLGKNVNGYFGEKLDLSAVLLDCRTAAVENGWKVEELPAHPKPSLLALTRVGRDSGRQHRRYYISSGIHGDEPAGPLAVRQLVRENLWPDDLDLYVLPCLNPTGFMLNRRENDEGTDLNRQYLQPKAEEILAQIRWLESQPVFDLCLCLHEDWESHGFYVYELNPDGKPSLAHKMIAAAERVCPIDPSEIIEGRVAQGGIIRPSLDPRTRAVWPVSGCLFL